MCQTALSHFNTGYKKMLIKAGHGMMTSYHRAIYAGKWTMGEASLQLRILRLLNMNTETVLKR